MITTVNRRRLRSTSDGFVVFVYCSFAADENLVGTFSGTVAELVELGSFVFAADASDSKCLN